MPGIFDQEADHDGRWLEECPVCDGSGIAKMESAIGDERELFDCPACAGEGYRPRDDAEDRA